METKNLDEKFTRTELGILKTDLAKIEQAARIKDDQIQRLGDSMRLLQQNLDAVPQVLRLNPTAEAVEAALRRKNKVPEIDPVQVSQLLSLY